MGPDSHLVMPSDTTIHYGNHSCDPTLWHVGPYEIATRRTLVAGEEATIDYQSIAPCSATSRIARTLARMDASDPVVTVIPANEASWEDLQSVFGNRGSASRCQCQRYKLDPGESFGSLPTEERAHRLRLQTDCDHPGADSTSGLVAYCGSEPVGWCAVEPRPAYVGLVRNQRVAWDGRDEDRTDIGVWAVTCVLVRAAHRRSGVGTVLVRAAIDHARERGARALEAYPMTTNAAIDEELHVGLLEMFVDAGMFELSRPTKRRAVVRLDFEPQGGSGPPSSRA